MRPLLLLLVAAGCASSPVPPPDRVLVIDDQGRVFRTSQDAGQERSYPVSVDELWKAAIAAYDLAGVEVAFQDRTSGQFGNRKVTFMRQFAGQPGARYLSCGNDSFTGPIANTHRMEMSVVSVVRKKSELESVLEVRVEGFAKSLGASTDAIHCSSTGHLEQRIHQLVKMGVAA